MNGSTPSLRREAGRRLLGSLFFRLLIVLLILYTVYHCAVAATPRMTTAIVVEGEERVMTTGQATLFRDEQVLTVQGQGLLLSYPLESGAKVSADSALATLYTTALDAQELAGLQGRLSALDAAAVCAKRAERRQAYTTTVQGAASLGTVHRGVCDRIVEITGAISDQASFAALRDPISELTLLLHAYDTLTDPASLPLSPLEAIEGQKNALLATVARSTRTLTLREAIGEQDALSGYFYHADAVDGYETVFSRTALATMNIADYDAMHRAQPLSYTGRTLLGKTVESYRWSLTLPVDPAVADGLTVGQTLDAHFPEEEGIELSMTLERIVRSVGDGRAILVLTSDVMPPTFRFTRFQTVQLVLQTVRGYRVPESALRQDGAREYVYILKDGCVREREVTVLMRGQGYGIVAEEETGGLSRNDVVITAGKNLYDGKYID